MAKAFHDMEHEAAPREELERIQLTRLREAVDRAYHGNRFYRGLYEEGGVTPQEVRALEDVQNLPFLDSAALKEAGPHGLAMGTRKSLMGASGGTIGKLRTPVLFFTRKDHRALGGYAARGLWMAGVREGDVLLNLHPYSHLGGGWGYHLGAQALGVCTVAAAVADDSEALRAALDVGPTAICGTPAAVRDLGNQLRERKGRLRGPRVSSLVLKHDCTSNDHGEDLDRLYGVPPCSCFSPLPAFGGVMSYQCSEAAGWHVWADGFLIECVDTASGDWVPEGSPGEMVITWLGSEGAALIRYRTGLLVTLDWAPCDCGRTHPRLSAILGRASDALKLGERLVFPRQVEKALSSLPEIGPILMRVERPRSLARFILRAELADTSMVDNHDLYQDLVCRITERLEPLLGLQPRIELLPPGGLSE